LESIEVRCPAKINLFLRVGLQRGDGYHEIETVYHSIALHDTLTLRRTSRGISVRSDHPDVPAGPANLAHRAAALLIGSARQGVDIAIRKNIPVGAGLGGGSADAAGALVGVNRLLDLGRSAEELAGLAETLGSDVRFMLSGGCAIGRGRGEVLTPVPPMPSLPVVVVIPPLTISTAWAYRSLRIGLTTPETALSMITTALEGGDVTSVWDLLENDFEGLVFERFPLVKRLKDDLLRLGADGALMSGSGPVVYGVFSKLEVAEACAAEIGGDGPMATITYLAGRGVTAPI
jgi:4-diphosphocytidyl-2-C-methyl-D-erythritol kinase